MHEKLILGTYILSYVNQIIDFELENLSSAH